MPFFFFVGIIMAFADWIAVSRQARGVRWVTKPGTLLCILLWFATSSPATTSPRITWFTLALCFSLVGDIFLQMRGDQLLKGGLSFALAHISFITAYNLPLQIPAVFWAILVLTLIVTFIIFKDITAAIRKAVDAELAWGVWAYAVILAAMTSTALSTLFRPEWPGIAAWPTAVGGILFYTSDVLLFKNNFVKVISRGRLLIMISYHLAQFALTYGYLWFLYS
jgi:uncharacterized membrane protein YhhN